MTYANDSFISNEFLKLKGDSVCRLPKRPTQEDKLLSRPFR